MEREGVVHRIEPTEKCQTGKMMLKDRMEWMEWEALARNRHPPYDGPFVESWDNRWLSID
jgi:hypothetical protein